MTKTAIVIQTHGSLMNLRVKFMSNVHHDGMFFPEFAIPDQEINFKEALVHAYKDYCQSILGLDLWLPSPEVKHLSKPTAYPNMTGHEVNRLSANEIYWIHCPKSNQHRVAYSENHLSHTIPLEIAMAKADDAVTRTALRSLIIEVNHMNTL